MSKKENNKKSMDKIIQWNKRKKERNSKKKQVWTDLMPEKDTDPIGLGYWEKVNNLMWIFVIIALLFLGITQCYLIDATLKNTNLISEHEKDIRALQKYIMPVMPIPNAKVEDDLHIEDK
jgi:hypothetical protein